MSTTLTRVDGAGELEGSEFEHVDLSVSGMTCGSCAARVQRALGREPGVVDAVVNYATGRAAVTVSPDMVEVERLIATVKRAGYGAEPLASGAEAHALALEEQERTEAAEQRMLLRRLAVALPLTVAIALLTYLAPHNSTCRWLTGALAVPVQFWCGWPFLRSAWNRARARSTNMDTLIALSTLASFVYSTVMLITQTRSFERGVAVGQFEMRLDYDMGATIITALLFARWCDARARRRAGRAVRELARLGATQARLVDPADPTRTERLVPAAHVHVGDVFAVRPGDRVPVDGIVLDGSSAVNESMLTGESLPVEKCIGAQITSATINLDGILLARATAVGADTAFAQLVALVDRAQASKPPIQRLADRIAGVFVPAVIVLSALTALVWILTGQGEHGMFASMHLERGMDAAIAVLIVACPCALGLATPVAILAGTGRGASLGLLIRGADVLEASRGVDTVVLDKTGTVTTGELSVADLWVAPGFDHDDVLALAAAVERSSEHPVAAAIVAAAKEHALHLPAVTDFRSIAGQGVRALQDGLEVRVGRPGSGHHGELDSLLAGWEMVGRTTVVVERGNALLGAIALGDTVKPEAGEAVSALQRMGVDVRLLTGDNPRAAHAIAAAVGIQHVLAEVKPAAKLDEIGRLQQAGRRVAMVGDGVNDAAALAQADLGIAMGSGAGVAIEAADINLLSGDLRGVPRALGLARSTYTVILQNLGWAFGYNVIALPLAMTGLLDPALAAVAMGLSSITVVANSLRLRRYGAGRAQTGGRDAASRPLRSLGRRARLTSVAAATIVPVLLLGGLVLAAPNTFAVPSTASHTFAGPNGEAVQVEVTPLTAGTIYVHVYLYGTTNTSTISGRVPITATSSSGARATATVYSITPDHDFGSIHLQTGTWNLHVAVRDAAGHWLGGSFAIPVNLAQAVDAGGAKRPAKRAPAVIGSVPAATTAPDQLAVADELGPDIVTATVSHRSNRLMVELRTLNVDEHAATVPITVSDAALGSSCGIGCHRLSLPAAATAITVRTSVDGTSYQAKLPVAFVASGDQRAAEMMRTVNKAQTRLRSATADETLASSPSAVESTLIRVGAPNRFAYRLVQHGNTNDDTIVLGDREWNRTPGHRWQQGTYGTRPFSAAAYFDWWAQYDGQARLIDLYRSGADRLADIAAAAELQGLGPVWFRFQVNLTRKRVDSVRMITAAHFMTESWGNFNDAAPISPPASPHHP